MKSLPDTNLKRIGQIDTVIAPYYSPYYMGRLFLNWRIKDG